MYFLFVNKTYRRVNKSEKENPTETCKVIQVK